MIRRWLTRGDFVETRVEARNRRPAMTANVIAFILGIVAPISVVGWVLFFH
jgi:hypothetical protein